MGTKLTEMRDGCFHKALDDEPMFVLLARDPSAPALVRLWADQREAEITAGQRPASDMAQVTEARQTAARMALWRLDNDGAWREGRLPLDREPTPWVGQCIHGIPRDKDCFACAPVGYTPGIPKNWRDI